MTTVEKLKSYLAEERRADAQQLILSLPKAELKSLREVVLSPFKDMLEYVKAEGKHSYRYYRQASDEQAFIINFIGIFCLTKRDFQKMCSTWFLRSDPKTCKMILDSGKVSWFLRFIKENNSFTYNELMSFAKEGYFETDEETLTARLVASIGKYNYKETPKFTYTPAKLEAFPETLENHIWNLFTYESNINHFDASRYQVREMKEPIWKYTLKTLADQGKIDRNRLLKECLLASTRNFNKTLTGWFMDLLNYLEPSESELIDLQPALFHALNSPQSKAVNSTLKILKTLATNPSFDIEGFSDQIQPLLNSETKSIVTSCFVLFNKILRKHKSAKSTLAESATMALASPFREVQVRAAKFIVKHGDAQNANLKSNIELYANALLAEARTLLGDFLETQTMFQLDADFDMEIPDPISAANKLIRPKSVEDFVFLASQAFDNNEPHHWDYFCQGLLDFQAELGTKKVLQQLEPAFERAHRTRFSEARGKTGQLDDLLAVLFMDYGKNILLKDRKPQMLSELFQKYQKTDDSHRKQYNWYEQRIVRIKDYKPSKYNPTYYYKPFHNIATFVYENLAEGQTLQLLSTPTHNPCWIEPLTLVKRLEEAQQKKHPIHEQDLSLAIARCSMQAKDLAVALTYAKANLTDEIKRIMLFLLDPMAEIPKQAGIYKDAMSQAYFNKKNLGTTPPPAWLSKIRQLEMYQGEVAIAPSKKDYTDSFWNYTTKKYEKRIRQAKRLNLSYEGIKPKLNLATFFKTDARQYLSLDFLSLQQYYEFEHRDVQRILSLCPNNTEALAFFAVQHIYDKEDYWSSTAERALIALFEGLLELPQVPAKATHLFLACSLLAKPKTVRALAAEYWTQLVASGKLDSAYLGEQIGKIQAIEMFPMRRMTDILAEQMLNISQQHNQALAEMLEHTIAAMGDTPAKNSKKLLEILLEARASSKNKVLATDVKLRLEAWSKSASLKSLVKQLAA